MFLKIFVCHLIFVNVLGNYPRIRYDPSEIHGYHFHTYFFQKNEENVQEALYLRKAIQYQIINGSLTHCRLNRINLAPRGPHPVGSYETCCNKTSISPALSWFMLNHGNLSILVHPLTRYEVLDHTDRSMFLGARLPLDISVLQQDLGDDVDLCLPLQFRVEERETFDKPKSHAPTITTTAITPKQLNQQNNSELDKWFPMAWMEEIRNNTWI